MTEFQALKEEQLSYLENVKKFKTIVSTMGDSGIELMEQSLEQAAYLIQANGLIEQLQNPNISLSVVAEVSNGKSTFLNALIFKDQVLHTGSGAVTARLFKIDYGDTYTVHSDNHINTYASLDLLKNAVENLNIETREKMDKDKEISESDVQEVAITLPHNSLKDGITIYDTPGFGALDERFVYPIIQKSVAKSDAIIMLLDIFQGIKKGEDKFVKEVLKSIPADKRFVIFNKIDAVINEDQKVLMGEDELNRQLSKVKYETLKQLSSISGIAEDEILNYSLSAAVALIGFQQKDQKKIDESYFEKFETDFWHIVVNSKKEFFENRIITYKQLIENCFNNVEWVKVDLEKKYNELKNLQTTLIDRKAEFSAFTNQSVFALDKNIKEFTLGASTVFSINGLLDDIKNVLENAVYAEIDNISWLDKLQFWNLKDKYTAQIEEAISDSTPTMQKSVENYIENIIKQLHSAQNGINITLDEINKKIINFSDLGVTPLENINILVQTSDGKYSFNEKSNFADFVSLDKEVFVLIGGIIAEIIAGRLVTLIPGIGLAIAASLAIISKAYKSYKDPNKELAIKVATSVIEGLEKSLNSELEKYTSQTSEIKNAMSLALLSAKAKLKMIEESFENPQKREKELTELRKSINMLDTYQKQLNNLRGTK